MANTMVETKRSNLPEAPVQGDVRTEEMLINMGPQHPSTHGVLRLVLRTDGEMVLETVPHIGYLHRCAEKIGENVPPYQYIPYTDRMDYLAGMNNNHAFALAVEKLTGLEVPERAQYIRVIFAELNRIASHLVAIGTFGLDMGAWSMLVYCFREREMILDLFEATCGARLTYSYITIGGVTDDLPEDFADKCNEFLDFFEPKIEDYNQLLSFNHIFVRRTADIGTMSAEDVIAYGLTGPNLRASGVKFDLRKALPYDIYDRLTFDVPVGEPGGQGRVPRGVVVGDCWNRYYIRVLEMEQSIRIIRQCLAELPPADKDGVCHKKNRNVKLPKDEIYFEAENPRGQLGFYIQGDGTAVPSRVKVRGPTFCHLGIMGKVARNVLIADVPAILGSIDVVLGEVDR